MNFDPESSYSAEKVVEPTWPQSDCAIRFLKSLASEMGFILF